MNKLAWKRKIVNETNEEAEKQKILNRKRQRLYQQHKKHKYLKSGQLIETT